MSRATMDAATFRATTTEAEFQNQVMDLAALLGWHVEHFPQMQMNPAGFPDLAMWRDDSYILAELKREGGKPRPSQVRWAQHAAASGVRVHLWVPSMWGEIEATLRGEP